MKIFKLLLLVIFISSCENKIKENSIQPLDNCKTIDSLQKDNYFITNKINYFTLKPYYSKLNLKKEENLIAIKNNNSTINIIECSCMDIYRIREISKHSNKYCIEKQVWNEHDAGVIKYFTIYYSFNKIIITVINKDIFSEDNFKFYLSEVFILDHKFVTEYSYKNTSNLHLKDENMLLTKNQLDFLNENEIKNMFFDKKNVTKTQFLIENFAEKDTYIHRLFTLKRVKSNQVISLNCRQLYWIT